MVLANSNGCAAVDRATSSQPEESHSVINFKTGYNNFRSNSGCFLSFGQNPPKSRPKIQQQSGCSVWEDDNPIHRYQNQLHPKCTTSGSPLFQEFKCVDQSDNTFGEEALGGSDSEADANAISTAGMSQEFGTRETCFNKRPNSGESIQPLKKPKSKSTHPSKDPQSMAAKNRRQRITERIKTLQELVPNGSKVDLVTMLEKAISYVKFLQLQVKVLATDEFWPVQGRKAPDLSQVKEAH